MHDFYVIRLAVEIDYKSKLYKNFERSENVDPPNFRWLEIV